MGGGEKGVGKQHTHKYTDGIDPTEQGPETQSIRIGEGRLAATTPTTTLMAGSTTWLQVAKGSGREGSKPRERGVSGGGGGTTFI